MKDDKIFMREKYPIFLFALAIFVVLAISSCLHGYLPATADDPKPDVPHSSNRIKLGQCNISVYLSEASSNNSGFTVGLSIGNVDKEKRLKLSDVKVGLKDYPSDTGRWHLQYIKMARLDYHRSGFDRKDSIAGATVNDAQHFDLSEGDLYTISYYFVCKAGRKHAKNMQVVVEGKAESVAGVEAFKKNVIYKRHTGVEILH